MKALLKRSLSGFVYAGLIAVGLLGPQPCFPVVFGALLVLALCEFYRMSMGKTFPASRTLLCLGAVLLFISVYLYRMQSVPYLTIFLSLIPTVAAVVLPIWSRDYSKYGLMAYGVAGLFFIALPLVCTSVMCVHDGKFSGILLLDLFVIVSLSDVGAFFFGSTLGRKGRSHKLAPNISAHKTWWGLCGGLLFAVIASLLLVRLGLLPFKVVDAAVFAVLMSVLGVLGDLVESMWKRYFHVKDSGKIIPGHGGVYDRLDSMMLAIPAATLYLSFSGLLQ